MSTIIFISLFSPSLQGQTPDTSRHVLFQQNNIEFFALDPLQNLYTVDSSGLLTKYDPSGKELFSYNNTTKGALKSIDASDPFNILLFYLEQQNLVLLDRTLSERSDLDLRNTAIGQASASALSHDNNIWVFDDFESQLIKIDATANTLLQSDNLRLTENISQAAEHIFKWKDKILVNFPNHGIAVFNLFAQLEDWWPIEGIFDGQVNDQSFAYHTRGGHFIFFPRPEIIEPLNGKDLNNCSMVRTLLDYRYLLLTDGTLVYFKI